jgi:hypothetical protein
MRRIAILSSLSILFAVPVFANFAGTDLILPAIGRVTGVGGSQFYTTVWITNPGSSPVDFEIAFLLAGQANLNPSRVNQSIAPKETKSYENIAETLFGIKGLLGAARIRSSADLIVSSRIYNVSDGQTQASSQGLFYAAIPSRFGIAKGEASNLQGVRQDNDYRYNIVAVECEGKSATLRLQVRDAIGNVLAETTFTLQPYEQRLLGVGTLVGSVMDGVVDASTIDGDGRVIIAGSQIANGSQDASGFEMAFRPDLLGSGTITSVIAGAGLTGGGTSGSVTLGIAAGGITAAMLAPGSAVRSVNGFKDDVSILAGANTSVVNTPSGVLISTSVSAGPQGVPGVQGPPGLRWRGAWNSGSPYSTTDAVSFNGASFVAVAPNTGQQPDTSPGSWNLLADRANFSGAAAGGDLSGTFPNPTIASVGGQTAVNVAGAVGTINAATSANSAGAIVRRDGSGNFSAGTITASLAGNATSAANFSGALAGDVTGTQGATVVANVGGLSAANLAAGANAANAATNANAPNTIVKRDAVGNLTATSATNFSGPLAGDVTGAQGATVVANVGGLSAANLAAGANAANAATNANTPNAIVKRDALGNFAAGTITGALSGNATSATNFSGALAGDVTGTQGATVVANVSGLPAANLAAGANAANAATSASLPNAIVKRDIFGNFAAGTITATLNGTATNFSGGLGGEVTGSQGTTVVTNAVSANTASAIVRRDNSGGFSAGSVNVASLSATGDVAFNTAGSTLYAAGSLAARNLRIIAGHVGAINANTGDVTVSQPNTGHYVLTFSPPLTNMLAIVIQPTTTLINMGYSPTFNMPGFVQLSAIDVDFVFGGNLINADFDFIIVGFQ